MPLLGAHTSVAGGLHLAFNRLCELNGQAMQIFTKNERQWNTPAISRDTAMLFKKAWEESGKVPVAAHDSYLINLAALDPVVLEKSVKAFADELKRCNSLQISYLVTHPGAHLGQGVETGLVQFVRNMDRAIYLSETSEVIILIETTAGQGTQLGSSFEEIAFILGASEYGDRLGVCLDTCHIFAAGYDIHTRAAYEETIHRFRNIIGIERLKFFHLNDSKRELGSRVDRHEHIGKGKIGLEAFKLILNDPRFSLHPMVLETPKENGLEKDKENLRTLRSCLAISDPLSPDHKDLDAGLPF
ncbi:MAG: deoxyribonuclease IV [Syntrophobacteraceae bacterium]